MCPESAGICFGDDVYRSVDEELGTNCGAVDGRKCLII
jgi:hypothetical protein